MWLINVKYELLNDVICVEFDFVYSRKLEARGIEVLRYVFEFSLGCENRSLNHRRGAT